MSVISPKANAVVAPLEDVFYWYHVWTRVPCSGDWHTRAQDEQMVLSGVYLAWCQGSGIRFALLSLPLCFRRFLCLASWLLWAADWFCYRVHLLSGLHPWLSVTHSLSYRHCQHLLLGTYVVKIKKKKKNRSLFSIFHHCVGVTRKRLWQKYAVFGYTHNSKGVWPCSAFYLLASVFFFFFPALSCITRPRSVPHPTILLFNHSLPLSVFVPGLT